MEKKTSKDFENSMDELELNSELCDERIKRSFVGFHEMLESLELKIIGQLRVVCHEESKKLSSVENTLSFGIRTLNQYAKCNPGLRPRKTEMPCFRDAFKVQHLVSQTLPPTKHMMNLWLHLPSEICKSIYTELQTKPCVYNIRRGTWRNPTTIVKAIKKVGSRGAEPTFFSHPGTISIHPTSGLVYVSEIDNHRITILSPNLDYVRQFGSRGTGPVEFYNPNGISFNHDGSILAISDFNNSRVVLVSPEGESLGILKNLSNSAKSLSKPQDVDFDTFGNIYVADQGNQAIQKYDKEKNYVQSIGIAGAEHPVGKISSLSINHENEIMAVSDQHQCVHVYSLEGVFIRDIPLSRMHSEYAYIEQGYQGGFVISDLLQNRITFHDSDGSEIHSVESFRPCGVVFAQDGSLYVADNNSHSVSKW